VGRDQWLRRPVAGVVPAVVKRRQNPAGAATGSSAVRLGVAGASGVVVMVTALQRGAGAGGPVLGWVVAALVFVLWTWAVVRRMDAGETAAHATANDPARATADVVLLLASLASLAGVAALLTRSSSATDPGHDPAAALGVGSVAAAWLVVHTVFALRYARLYYAGTTGGIDFNQDTEPRYLDFAYLAFTIGMTYQVSDTPLRAPEIRMVALRHALLSFLLGAVVLATTINLVAGLGSAGG
jgi:uncharacterized membrane protein